MFFQNLTGQQLTAWEQKTLAHLILAEIQTDFTWFDPEIAERLKAAYQEINNLPRSWQRELAYEVVLHDVNHK